MMIVISDVIVKKTLVTSREALNQQKFDELNVDDSYRFVKFVKYFIRQNFLAYTVHVENSHMQVCHVIYH